ncbi:MAG: hypothetical protein JXA73_09365 [Acidobacteria bacterium]|nr:hypothetical protein [Acidobacteriota bacterium]
MNSRSKTSARLFATILAGCIFAAWSGGEQKGPEPLSTPLTQTPIAVGGGEIGNMLRQWYADGTAAGNAGDYYDNRDGGHSLLNLAPYPQLQKIEYSEEQIKTHRNSGMQTKILPHVVFGNSSTSAPPRQGGSNIRSYYVSSDGLTFLCSQYLRNNLYIYPEHLDHDPGHNGIGGYGDLYPTNTPYLIASQGSSGSDQPFMKAMPYVLAAFRPEVKKKLVQTGLLMPTIQMLLRMNNPLLSGSKEYLTGKAHPAVFQGTMVNVLGMVETAHKITPANMPPIALIRAVKEDTPSNGMDYFEPEHSEKLGDTPAVIARIFRGASYYRKITVSAENSRDVNRRPLKFYWTVLRGDSSKIKIEYKNPSRSVAEITIPYQERAPIAKDSLLESNRIDIGVFVHNGAYYSPPAFVTFYTLDNEARTYSLDRRPLEIAYGAGESIVSIKDWTAFFDALASSSESWPNTLLRSRFISEEIEALNKLAIEYRTAHAALLAEQEKQAKAAAASKAAGNSPDEKKKAAAALHAAQKAVNQVRMSEKNLLDKKITSAKISATDLVQRALDSLLRDTDFWSANSAALKRLCESAGKAALDKVGKIRNKLVQYGVAESPDGELLNLTPLVKGNSPLKGRLTRFEKGMMERLNAVVLGQIVFPGIVADEWRENYVDFRITSSKDWRDVYRYAPDGTPAGWTRLQPDGKTEFNAEGLLVLEKDALGRCVRAQNVRYELEPQRRDSQGRLIEPFLRKLKMIPVDAYREYEYDGENDWKGHPRLR